MPPISRLRILAIVGLLFALGIIARGTRAKAALAKRSVLPRCPWQSELRGSQCWCKPGFLAMHPSTGSKLHQAEAIDFDTENRVWIGECQQYRCTMPYKNLLFAGGGVKGIAYAGVVRALQDNRILEGIEGVSGASAGSHIAALISAGYVGQELVDVMTSFNFKALLDGGNVFDALDRYGLYRGDALEKAIDGLLAKKAGKNQITFDELYAASCANWHGACKHLRIPSFCVNTGQLVWFDHLATPKVRVALVVRASSSIPLFYQPTAIDMPDGKRRLFVDAGLTQNLPHDAFDTSTGVGTLGFLLAPPALPVVDEFKSFTEYLAQLTNGASFGRDSSNSVDRINDAARIDLVQIDTLQINATDFDLPASSKVDLLVNGYAAVYKKLAACQYWEPGKASIYAEIQAKPTWLYDLRAETYSIEFSQKLQSAGDVFNDWWKQKGKPFFRPFVSTVEKESEMLGNFHTRQVEFMEFRGTVPLLMTFDPKDTLRVRDVFLMSGIPQREIGYVHTWHDHETVTCVRVPLMKVAGKKAEFLEKPAEASREMSLKFCGEHSFSEHICGALACVDYAVIFQGSTFSSQDPLRLVETVVMLAGFSTILAITADPSLPFKFQEAFLLKDGALFAVSPSEVEFLPGVISYCIDLPVQKLDVRLTSHSWDPSKTVEYRRLCSQSRTFANSLDSRQRLPRK